jgi:hypothetical protein
MIDIKNKVIIGKSGKKYRIAPEEISAGRWHLYMIYSTSVGMGVMFQEVFDSFSTIYKAATNGNDILGALDVIKKEAETKIKFIDRYKANEAPKVIEMCALFCIGEGEDVGEFSDTLVAQKFEDWKHIPITDFFLLSSMAIPGFKEEYERQTASEKQPNINQV